MTNAELADYFLRRLYDLAEQEGYDRLHSLEAIAAEVGVDDRAKVVGVAQNLERQGLIQAAHTFGGSDARILGPGTIQVEAELSISSERRTLRVPTPTIGQEKPAAMEPKSGLTFEDLLHPSVANSAYKLWTNEHYREAALNAILAVFDLVRQRTGLDLDGEQLATRAFSATSPHLVVADLSISTGRNDQIGFMQLLQGSYRGLRTPQAHTLQHTITKEESARYLVLASLLAGRVAAATRLERDNGA